MDSFHKCIEILKNGNKCFEKQLYMKRGINPDTFCSHSPLYLGTSFQLRSMARNINFRANFLEKISGGSLEFGDSLCAEAARKMLESQILNETDIDLGKLVSMLTSINTTSALLSHGYVFIFMNVLKFIYW